MALAAVVSSRRRPLKGVAGILVASIFGVSIVATAGCRFTNLEVCDAGEACALSCAVDGDCESGVCTGGLCSGGGVLPIDPNDGSAGVVSLSPGPLFDFGAPDIGALATRTLTVGNVGRGQFILNSIAIGPQTPFDYSWTSTASLPVFVAAGDSVEVELRLTRVGDFVGDGRYLLSTNAGGCDATCSDPSAIEITATTSLGGEGALAVSPPLFDFGTVALGNSSPATSVAIRNTSVAEVLGVQSISLSGAIAAFVVDNQRTPPYELSAGGSEDFDITFVPHIDGAHDATLTVVTAGGQTITSSFSGRTGVDLSTLAFTPTTLTFDVGAPSTTERQPATLTNSGNVSVTLSTLEIDPPSSAGNAFVLTVPTSLPVEIAAGDSIPIEVEFQSQTATSLVGTLVAVLVSTSTSAASATLALQAIAPGVEGGPNLGVVAAPETTFAPACICQATPDVSAANIDLVYRSPIAGTACGKPTDPTCGINGTCPCSAMNTFGVVEWGSARTEDVRGAQWIIDEKITHTGVGDDGVFLVRVDLADDCLAVPASLSPAINHTCCELDCNSEFNPNAPQACFDYGAFPSCASFCDGEVASLSATDCFERGPVAIRTVVTLSGGASTFVRHFCTTLAASGASRDVVEIVRTNGIFTVSSVLANVVEVDAAAACP